MIKKDMFDKDGQKTVHRLTAPVAFSEPLPVSAEVPVGIVFDVETTGLSKTDEVYEVGAVVFEFDENTSRPLRVLDMILDRWEPACAFHPDAAAITGVDMDALKGTTEKFRERITDWIAQASVVVCHNAAFDRPRLEALYPDTLGDTFFLCTYADLPPVPRRKVSRSLPYLCYEFGGFYVEGGHGALVDAYATFAMLLSPFPEADSTDTMMKCCMDIAGQPFMRILAWKAPFEKKDALREAGLRWYPDMRVWGNVLRPDMAEATVDKMRKILGEGFHNVELGEVTAFDKYTDRELIA